MTHRVCKRGALLAGSLVFSVIVTAPELSFAQDVSQSITKTARSLRVPSGPSPVPLTSQDSKAATAVQDITVGIGYESADGGGHSISTPLQYGYLSPTRQWNMRIESGYSRVTAGGDTLSGVSSLTLLGTHVLAASGAPADTAWKVLGTLGLGFPTHGELGSDKYSQQARLIGLVGQGRWTGVLAGVLVHLNGQASGASSLVKVLHGEVHYDLRGGTTVIGKLDRSYRSGSGGNTSATLEIDLPLSKSLETDFILTRGLTKGSRSTGLEVDFVYRF